MALGPVEVLVIAFPGNDFNGQILPELQKLVEADQITIIDGLLIIKDADGNTAALEFTEDGVNADLAAIDNVLGRHDDLLSDEDVEALTADLAPDSSGAILVFEHTWAKGFRDAVVASGGELIDSVRLPGLLVDELLSAR